MSPAPLHGKGWLQKAVQKVCKAYVDGKLKLPEGKLLTPTAIANAVQKAGKLDAPPSTGAVSAVLDRWAEYDFAVIKTEPHKHFVKFGKNGEKKLDDIVKDRSAKRTAEREKSRPAKPAPAKKAAAKKAPAKKAAARK